MITEAIRPVETSRRDFISFGRSRRPTQLASQALEPARKTIGVVSEGVKPLVEAGQEIKGALDEVRQGLNDVATTVNEALGEALDDKNSNANPAILANSDGSKTDLEEEETYYPFLELEPTQISVSGRSMRVDRKGFLGISARWAVDLFSQGIGKAVAVTLPLSYGLIMQNTDPTARATQVTEENTVNSEGKLSRRRVIALAGTAVAVGAATSLAACSPAPGSASASAAKPIGPTSESQATPTPSYKEEKNDSSRNKKTLVTDIDLNGTLPQNDERKPHIRELTENLQNIGTPASYYHIVTSSGGEYEAAFEPAYKQTATYKDAKGENIQVEQEVVSITVIGIDGKPHERIFVFSKIPDTGENVEVAQLSLGVKTADGNIRPDFKSSLMTFYRFKGSNKILAELPDLNGTTGQPILLEFTQNTNIDFTGIFEFFLKLGALEAEAAEPTATPTWTQTASPIRTSTSTKTPEPSPTPFPTLTLTSTATPTSTQTFLPTATRTRIPDTKTATRKPATPRPIEDSPESLKQQLADSSIKEGRDYERAYTGAGKILILVGGRYGFDEGSAQKIKDNLDWLAQTNPGKFAELIRRGARIIWKAVQGKSIALNNRWIVIADDSARHDNKGKYLAFLGHESAHLLQNSSGTDDPWDRCLKSGGYFGMRKPDKDKELDAVDGGREFTNGMVGLTSEEIRAANDEHDYAEQYYRERSVCGN